MRLRIYKPKRIRLSSWKETVKAKRDYVIKLYHHGLVGQICVTDNLISNFVVNPSKRRKGYGSKLLREAEKLIFQNFEEAVLVPEDNAPHLRMYYSKRGFTGFSESEEGYEPEDKSWWIMTKKSV